MMDDQIKLVKKTVNKAQQKLYSGKIYESLNMQLENLAGSISKKSRTIVKPIENSDEALSLMQKNSEKFIKTKKIFLTDDQIFAILKQLGSTNPTYRDHGAFYFLTDVISNKAITLKQMRWITNYLISDKSLFDHILEPVNDAVFKRSFSVLILSQLLAANNKFHFIDSQLKKRIIVQIASYSLLEKDPRGFVGGKGWAHAFLHLINTLILLCGDNKIIRADKVLLLGSVLVGYHNITKPFVAGEDSRMASFLGYITNLNEIYEDYFLRVLKFWHQDLTNQMSVSTEAGWNKVYNRNRLLQVIMLKKKNFPTAIIQYIKDTNDYLN